MSSSNPLGGDFPFFDFSSIFGGMNTGDPWKAAADMAVSIASDGGAEPNLDPVDRIQTEELSRVAELHVNQAVGLSLPADTRISPVTRSVWTRRSLDAHRPLFERFGEALSSGLQDDSDEVMPSDGNLTDEALSEAQMPDITAKMMEQMFAALGPMLVSTSAASMMGHLGQRTLGQYDLPIPRNSNEVLVIPTSIDSVAAEWDVPTEDLRLWVLVHELSAHAVLSVPHVGARLESLLLDFASAFRPNTELIGEKFGSMTDLSQIQELSESLSDPDTVLSMLRSPAHDLLMPQLDALVAAVLGFVDHTVSEICRGLVLTHEIIRDRFRQRWVDVAPADRFMERLFGLEIDESTLRRGENFIDGIVERAGDDGLARLWADELDLPTAAEVDAPGLWLARIGLDGDFEGGGMEVPDDLSGLDDIE